MFLAEFLDVFGVSIPKVADTLFEEDHLLRIERRAREAEKQLDRLRFRLIRCRKRIERLRNHIASTETCPLYQSEDSIWRIKHLENIYARLVSRTISTRRRLVGLRRQQGAIVSGQF